MTEVVVDASVVLSWFSGGDAAADRVREAFERGELHVVVPSLHHLEIVNVAGRRWGWDPGALGDLATALGQLGFEVADADLLAVAAWTGRGLTAYDAAYVALAESRAIDLVTGDEAILGAAPGIARRP